MRVEPLPRGVGRRRTPHRPTKAIKDQIPPFWSEKVYGVARGAWEPRRAMPGGDCKPSRIIEIEQRVRAAARAQAPKGVSSREKFARDLVFRLLAARDAGGAPNYGKTAIKGVMEPFEHVGTVTPENFIKVLRRKLGVTLDMQEAVAVFKLYGHDEKGQMPYDVFCARIFGGDAKALAKMGYQDGAFIWDQQEAWDWDGMIRYPQCSNGVFPPSDWPLMSEQSCKLSKEKPDHYLKIEHVFGYTVQKSPNLYYNKNGDVVYFAAGAGVVYDDDGGGDDDKKNRQKFFLRHDGDIECLTLHPLDRDTVASGQFGVEPVVWIWSSSTRGAPLGVGGDGPIELKLPRGERSVIACGFSADGEYLATVSTDEGHVVRVWDWKRQQPLEGMQTNGYKGEPPAVFGVIWNPYTNDLIKYPDATATEGSDRPVDFITYGIKHLSFWNLGNGELEKTGTSFGNCTSQDVLHACFLPSGHVLTGGPNGSITIYNPKDPQGPAAMYEEKNAHADMSAGYAPRSDTAPHMVIVVKDDVQYSSIAGEDWEVTVLSGGAGGVIKEWKWNQDFKLVQSNQWDLNDHGSDPSPEVVAIDIDPYDENKFVAGTAGNDIWEVDGGAGEFRVMVEGQSDCVYGLAVYPRENLWGREDLSKIYASGCEDGNLYIWDAKTRECLHSFEVRRFDDHNDEEDDPVLRTGDGYPRNEPLKVRAVEWSENGDQLILTTCGVAGNDEDDDLGGVIQVYAVDEMWFVDDEQIYEYDAKKFLQKYRVWECKDCNAMIDDCKFSPDGKFIAACCHDSNVYMYRVASEYVEMPPEAAQPHATMALKVAYENLQRLQKLEASINLGAKLGDEDKISRDTSSDKQLRGLGGGREVKQLCAELMAKQFDGYCGKGGCCVGHSSYVSHIEWTQDSNVLQSTSGDFELLYWDIRGPRKGSMHGGKILQLRAERIAELGCAVRDMQWAGWTCLQGFPVMGMWQDGQCGNDINSCHRSPDGHSLVSSDDDGFVRLYNYPCVIKEAPHHALKGHAAFTENVRFLSDGKRVVSAGGGDRCLIQWRMRPVPGGGDKQKKIRKELTQMSEMHTLQQDADENELLLQEKEREVRILKERMRLKGTKGSVALRRSTSMDQSAAGGASPRAGQKPKGGLDLHKVKAEFARLAKREGGGRGKLRLPAFQMLMSRVGWTKSGPNRQMMGQRLFRAFDTGGDGKVSLDELEGGLLLLCNGRAKDKVDFMFSMVDMDGDGTVSQGQLELFVSGFFVLTEDAVDSVLSTVEKLLPHPIGEDGDGVRRQAVQRRHDDFRVRLQATVSKVLAKSRASIVERAMATADVDNDGEISLTEWRVFCDTEPQLLDWLDKLGGYWEDIIQGKKPGDKDGSQALSHDALQGFLHSKLGTLRLASLIEALKTVNDRLDEAGVGNLFSTLGIHNTKLASTMFQIFDPSEVPGDIGTTVDSRQILIGISTVCAAGHDPLRRLDFAFELFDADESGELDQHELHQFFETFRRPVLVGVADAMSHFYETCGYEEELREDVNTAAKAVFDDFVDAIVSSVFSKADTDNNQLVSKAAFLHWAGRHQESLTWLNNLAAFVLDSLSHAVRVEDFQPGDFRIKAH